LGNIRKVGKTGQKARSNKDKKDTWTTSIGLGRGVSGPVEWGEELGLNPINTACRTLEVVEFGYVANSLMTESHPQRLRKVRRSISEEPIVNPGVDPTTRSERDLPPLRSALTGAKVTERNGNQGKSHTERVPPKREARISSDKFGRRKNIRHCGGDWLIYWGSGNLNFHINMGRTSQSEIHRNYRTKVC